MDEKCSSPPCSHVAPVAGTASPLRVRNDVKLSVRNDVKLRVRNDVKLDVCGEQEYQSISWAPGPTRTHSTSVSGMTLNYMFVQVDTAISGQFRHVRDDYKLASEKHRGNQRSQQMKWLQSQCSQVSMERRRADDAKHTVNETAGVNCSKSSDCWQHDYQQLDWDTHFEWGTHFE
jgi:hypothetical protein